MHAVLTRAVRLILFGGTSSASGEEVVEGDESLDFSLPANSQYLVVLFEDI